jgi:hypothetical protein
LVFFDNPLNKKEIIIIIETSMIRLYDDKISIY